MEIRNAYAVPARARKNAGAMVHRAPVRARATVPGRCECCGAWLDEGDDARFCVDCEPEEQEFDNPWQLPVCTNCGRPDWSIDDPWDHESFEVEDGKPYCRPCLIRILRVRVASMEERCGEA